MRLPNQSGGVNPVKRETPQLAGALGPSAVGEVGENSLWCTDESCASLKVACLNGGGSYQETGSGGTVTGVCTVGNSGRTIRSLASLEAGRPTAPVLRRHVVRSRQAAFRRDTDQIIISPSGPQQAARPDHTLFNMLLSGCHCISPNCVALSCPAECVENGVFVC